MDPVDRPDKRINVLHRNPDLLICKGFRCPAYLGTGHDLIVIDSAPLVLGALHENRLEVRRTGRPLEIDPGADFMRIMQEDVGQERIPVKIMFGSQRNSVLLIDFNAFAFCHDHGCQTSADFLMALKCLLW